MKYNHMLIIMSFLINDFTSAASVVATKVEDPGAVYYDNFQKVMTWLLLTLQMFIFFFGVGVSAMVLKLTKSENKRMNVFITFLLLNLFADVAVRVFIVNDLIRTE